MAQRMLKFLEFGQRTPDKRDVDTRRQDFQEIFIEAMCFPETKPKIKDEDKMAEVGT